jgi:hypothetical protein
VRFPRFGEPARVAFVGQESSDGAFALQQPAGGLLPRFFDFRPAAGHDRDELGAALAEWAPHVVVTFAENGATLAANGVERTITDDPARAAWRTLPLPVDDRLYAPVRPPGHPPRAMFVGESTAHRERYLIGAKHEYDVLHFAHGLHGAELADTLRRVDIGINLRDELRPGFEQRALLYLAAGHLLLSEPLTPTFGLEPGTDFIEFDRPDEMMSALYLLQRRPDSYDRVRLAGRAKADAYRASIVWPRLIGDLCAELGEARRPSSPPLHH